MNRSKPRSPQTAPNVMNNELNACAVRYTHSINYFSLALTRSLGLLLPRGVAVFPSPFAWCCLSSCLLLGGADWFTSIKVVLLFLVLPSVFFGWSCFALLFGGVVLLGLLLGGAASPSPPLSGVAFSLLFCWLVLLGSFGWCCCFTFFYWVTQGSLCFLWCVRASADCIVVMCCCVFCCVFLCVL